MVNSFQLTVISMIGLLGVRNKGTETAKWYRNLGITPQPGPWSSGHLCVVNSKFVQAMEETSSCNSLRV